MDARTATGMQGQEVAEARYLGSGYRVLARNWRCRIGELDLVLARGSTLVLCEVKTRRGARFGVGFEAVDARKQAKIRAVAEAYLIVSGIEPRSIRFDVASVALRMNGSTSVEIFEDAF